MGERWFLGKIHYYANPGLYFGVPLSNFAGWFLVSLAIIFLNVTCWKFIPRFFQRTNGQTDKRTDWMFPTFYAGIALFIIAVTFSIGEWKLGIMSSVILSTIIALSIRRFAGAKQG